jgi:hypothetical protein
MQLSTWSAGGGVALSGLVHVPLLPRPVRRPDPPGGTPPGALDLSELRRLFGQPSLTPGSTFATLTPAQPHATQAALVIVAAALVEGGQGYAYWDETYAFIDISSDPVLAGIVRGLGGSPKPDGTEVNPGAVYIWVDAPKGARFLVDCSVSATSTNGGQLTLGAGSQAPAMFGPGSEHAVAILEPAAAGWTPVRLGSIGKLRWTLWKVEITNL